MKSIKDKMIQLMYFWDSMLRDYESKPPGKEKSNLARTLVQLEADITEEFEELQRELLGLEIKEQFSFERLTFGLDENFTIISSGGPIIEHFLYQNKSMYGLPFAKLLSTESELRWQAFKKELPIRESDQRFIYLSFLTANGKEIPTYCYFDDPKWEGRGGIVPTYEVKTCQPLIYQNRALQDHISTKLDIMILTQHHYSLPTMSKLATQYGISEHKLVKKFKEVHGLTPRQFYKKWQLDKAYAFWVPYNQHTLKKVASITGYKSYSAFLAAYKKQYGITPSQHRKSKIAEVNKAWNTNINQ